MSIYSGTPVLRSLYWKTEQYVIQYFALFYVYIQWNPCFAVSLLEDGTICDPVLGSILCFCTVRPLFCGHFIETEHMWSSSGSRGVQRTRYSLQISTFSSIRFSGKIGPIVGWRPSLGSPGSATDLLYSLWVLCWTATRSGHRENIPLISVYNRTSHWQPFCWALIGPQFFSVYILMILYVLGDMYHPLFAVRNSTF